MNSAELFFCPPTALSHSNHLPKVPILFEIYQCTLVHRSDILWRPLICSEVLELALIGDPTLTHWCSMTDCDQISGSACHGSKSLEHLSSTFFVFKLIWQRCWCLEQKFYSLSLCEYLSLSQFAIALVPSPILTPLGLASGPVTC